MVKIANIHIILILKQAYRFETRNAKKTDPTTPADGNAYSGESALVNGFRLWPTQQ